MKNIKLLLLLILTLSVALTAFVSCEKLEDLGIDLPFSKTEDETPEEETKDEIKDETNKVDPANCKHSITSIKNKVAATCSTEGYTGDEVCYSCGTVVKAGKAIATTEHNYKDGKCSVCGTEAPADQFESIKAEWAAKYNCITIAEALTLCEQFVEAPSSDRYYIIATVKSVDDTTYGKLMIEDETGSIMVYGTNSADGSLKYDKMGVELKAGDLILIYGTLQNYNGSTKEVQNAWLTDHVAGIVVPPTLDVKPGDTITIEKACEIAGLVGATDRFYIKATVSSITNAAYGAMKIADETGEISVYNSKNADGSVGYADMADKPYKGDEVLLYVTLQLFNGTTPEIKEAYIIEFTHKEIEINEEDYVEMSIADAREAADDAPVKISGVVARITYATGKIPSGFYLVDGTNSIYVYDGDTAARVAIGDSITVLASKAHWILESEVSNANKFGYKGCNQVTNVVRFECHSSGNAFDTSWITESTMKDIIETPVTTDITSTIYKVTALVKKVVPEGAGFVNYYFFDLDGETSAYAYTQCNGSDFAWLDEFDGKICTVYISALNAKSTASDCYWRFIPVTVSYDNFEFDLSTTPEFVLDYYVADQFANKYTADPALEITTSVSSELLGFEGATVSYSTSDATIGQFTTVDGKLIFNLVNYGTVTVTATVTYGEYTASSTYTIVYEAPVEYEYITVEEAIEAELGSVVVVKGIVGPSLVNQTGFYLMGDNGLIALTMSKDEMAKFEMGQLVIIQGTKDRKVKTNSAGEPYSCHGQTQLKDCTLLVNLYGNHSYSTESYAEVLTFDEFYTLDNTQDFTTTVFIVEAYVYVDTNSIKITDETAENKSNLYSSGVAQYAWLKDYNGQKLTFEIAACNWNSKNYYAGCVLSATLPDGTVVYNTLNFDN